MNDMNDLKDMFAALSNRELDSSVKPIIAKWSTPPKPIEILETLDCCIFGSLASGFIVKVLSSLYDEACGREKTTHEEVLKLATWRNEH